MFPIPGVIFKSQSTLLDLTEDGNLSIYISFHMKMEVRLQANVVRVGNRSGGVDGIIDETELTINW